MKITLEFLESLYARDILCLAGFDYIKQRDLVDTLRSFFIETVRTDELAGVAEVGYYQWCLNTLVNSEEVKRRVEFVPTGRFRAVGMNGFVSERDTRADARDALQSAWAANRLQESSMYDVQARTNLPDGGYSAVSLDIDSNEAPVADYYAAFNYNTGLYEEFSSAALAKSRARDRRAIREGATINSFYIEEEIRDDSDIDDILMDFRFYETLAVPRP